MEGPVKASPEFLLFIKEQLASLHDLASRRLFGGAGLCADGIQFAMLQGNTLYFVVDDSTRPAYEAMGSPCFSYDTSQRHVNVRRYYAVPAELIEDRERLGALARESLAVARRTSKLKRPGGRRAAAGHAKKRSP
jgi:DNA transformation protein and related proteins